MRLPLDPLLRATRMTPTELRNAVNTFSANITRAQRDGLSVEVADRWAVRLNLHPVEVWDEQWIEALAVPQ
jgi:hypothetical protein